MPPVHLRYRLSRLQRLRVLLAMEGIGYPIFGVLFGRERWYFFLDSIISIKQYRRDLWTIRQYTGLILHIPIELITDEQLQHFRAEMERGRTTEGVQAIIARGRMIEQLRREGK